MNVPRRAAGSGNHSVTQACVYSQRTEVHCKKVLQLHRGCLPLKAEQEPHKHQLNKGINRDNKARGTMGHNP